MQVISLHISIFLLWFETYFIVMYYRHMTAGPQGQQSGMATLLKCRRETRRSLRSSLMKERSAPRVGNGGNEYGNADTKCESPAKLKSGRASKSKENAAIQSNSALGRWRRHR